MQPGQIGLGRLEPAFALLFAATVFEYARGLFDDRAAIFGPGVEHRVDLALGDDHVLLTPHAAVAQQVLDVEQATRHAVDLVFAVAGAKQPPRDRDLFEFDRHEPGAVVKGDRDLGPAELLHRGGAGEDDVVHLL